MSVVPLTDEIIKNLEIEAGTKGVIIAYVLDDTPADIAGFKDYDIITKINKITIRNLGDFYKVLNDKNAKDLDFYFERKGVDLKIGLVR